MIYIKVRYKEHFYKECFNGLNINQNFIQAIQ